VVDYLTPGTHGDSERAYRSRLESRCVANIQPLKRYVVVGFILLTTYAAAPN